MNAPKIAGQSAWYLKRQIMNYKNGLRGTHEGDIYGRQMIGMVAAMIALLMSIDPILDMFRTVVNVCGDSLCCLFLNDTDKEADDAVAVTVQ